MIIEIDPSAKESPSAQIRAAVARGVAEGDLVPGSRLPSIRQLAGDLGVATNTVAKAYRELEADGVVISQGRRGTTVLPTASQGADRMARYLVAEFVKRSRELGLDAKSTQRLVGEALAN